MFCSISNERCRDPVVSKKTGHIFERSLIEKHLKVHKTCPITSADMTTEDIIPIASGNVPEPRERASMASIPSMLKNLENEWDEVMVSSWSLRSKLLESRQQLSHSLYQYDAAVRVIARLTEERDRALQELADTRESMASALSQIEALKAMQIESVSKPSAPTITKRTADRDDGDIEMEQKEDVVDQSQKEDVGGDGTVLSPSMVAAIEATSASLSSGRKAMISERASLAVTADRVAAHYAVRGDTVYSGHDSTECVALTARGDVVISGGADSQITVWDRSQRSIRSVLRGHSSTVNAVQVHCSNDEVVMSASSDRTAIIWTVPKVPMGTDGAAKRSWHLKGVHEAKVVALWQHPVDDCFVTADTDGLWAVHSLSAHKTWSRAGLGDDGKGFGGLNAFGVHPDGQIVAVGSNDGNVRIWDIRSNQIGYALGHQTEAKMENERRGRRRGRGSVAFNPNGYVLAYSDGTPSLSVWDLRKIAKQNAKGFLNRIQCPQRVRCAAFSPSGRFLAIGRGDGVQLFHGKKWVELCEIAAASKDGKHGNAPVNDLRFGDGAKFMVTANGDGTVRFIEAVE